MLKSSSLSLGANSSQTPMEETLSMEWGKDEGACELKISAHRCVALVRLQLVPPLTCLAGGQ